MGRCSDIGVVVHDCYISIEAVEGGEELGVRSQKSGVRITNRNRKIAKTKKENERMDIHPIIWATMLFSITCVLFAVLDRRTAKLKNQLDDLKHELEEMKNVKNNGN